MKNGNQLNQFGQQQTPNGPQRYSPMSEYVKNQSKEIQKRVNSQGAKGGLRNNNFMRPSSANAKRKEINS